jgi:ferric-dicitrate binding protein FerR (iron transport regulator)
MQNLIIKYFEGQIGPEEKRELFSRLYVDEECRKEFTTIQNIRGLTSWMPSTTDDAVAIGNLLLFKQSRKKKKIKSLYRKWIEYAAVIVVSVCSTWAVFHFSMHETEPAKQVADVYYEEFTTPAGQRALLRLQDGTTVWLNGRTTLRYPNHFSKNERRVELDGEAFFDVKENKESPFIVNLGKLSVKVTGTKFNVFAYRGNDEYLVSLTEGAVRVFNSQNEKNGLDLERNERAILKENRLWKESFSNMDFLLWKDGIYAFDNVCFSEMVKKLELYYDVTIVVKNRDLENYRFNGKFRQRDGIESALKTLMKIKKFTYTKDEEQNIITIR